MERPWKVKPVENQQFAGHLSLKNSSKFVRFHGDDDENSSHPLGVDQWIWTYCNKVPRGKSNNVKGSGGAY